MAISEEKMRMVIKNYFKTECDINTTINEAFEKGFRIGVQKGISAQPETMYYPQVDGITPSVIVQPEQSESAREYCAECNHTEMCRWYPYEGCEFRSLPTEQPERKTGRITYTHFSEELWGQSAICLLCGCKWQIAEEGEDNFCPNCGAQMIQEGEDNERA